MILPVLRRLRGDSPDWHRESSLYARFLPPEGPSTHCYLERSMKFAKQTSYAVERPAICPQPYAAPTGSSPHALPAERPAAHWPNPCFGGSLLCALRVLCVEAFLTEGRKTGKGTSLLVPPRLGPRPPRRPERLGATATRSQKGGAIGLGELAHPRLSSAGNVPGRVADASPTGPTPNAPLA